MLRSRWHQQAHCHAQHLTAPAALPINDTAVAAMIKGRPAFRIRAGEDNDTGRIQGGGQMRRARVIANQQPRIAQ